MWYITTMASSEEDDGNSLKFYFYARDVRNNTYFCVEMHVLKESHQLYLSIRGQSEEAAVNLKKYILGLLSVN